MAKLKDGFYKLTASSIGSDLLVLLAGGGAKPISDFASAFNVKIWGLDFDGSSDVKGNLTLGYNQIYIGDGTDNFRIGWGNNNMYVYHNYYGHYFSTKSGEVMSINSSGNVGIGTLTPSLKLDVVGSIQSSDTVYGKAITAVGNTVGPYLPNINWFDLTKNVGFHVSYRLNETAKPLRFYYKNSDTFTLLVDITSSGSVGIGTTGPSYKLHVNGSVYGDHYYGNAITLYTRGSGTYNRAWISAKDDAGDFIIEAPLTTDSASGTRAPITLTWRGGFPSKGGLKITGHSEAVLGGNKIWHAGNDGSGSGLDADLLDGYHRSNLYASSEAWFSAVGLTKSITVTGDSAYWYPVVITCSSDKQRPTFISIWKDLGSTTPSISGNHSNGTSSLWLQYEMRKPYWDGNGGYLKTWYKYQGYGTLVAHTKPNTSATGLLIVWLRGGTCLYYISCTNSFSVNVYYSSTNITGSSSYPDNVDKMSTVGNGGIYTSTYLGYGDISGNATTATTAATANNVVVNNSDSNSTYRMVWHSGNTLYGTGGIYCNPSTDQIYSAGFKHVSYDSSSYLLRSDGGAAAFNWSGQSGQPTWLWGGNSQHTYYVYNPSNFNVNSAAKLRVVSCYNGTTNNDLWSTIKSSNSSYLGTSTMYEVYNDGGPTTYGHVLDTVTVHSNHWQSQLWMASGKGGRLYYRNKDYNNNTWGDWKTVAWTTDTAPSVTVTNSDSNSTYRMVWHSGNNLYSTAGIYCNPSTDYLYASSMNASDWFRSSGNTGWYNPTNNCHVYPNATTTYGGLMFRGEKGGYTGFVLGTSNSYMNLMDNGTDKGLYLESNGLWILYYNRSSKKVGILTSTITKTINLAGSTYISSTLDMGGAINTASTPGTWVSGMSGAAILYRGLSAIDGLLFWRFFNMKSSGGHVVCYGGLGNDIGFYGYYSGRTANGTDWRFTVATASGNWTATASIYAAHFYENSDLQLKTNIQEILNSDKMPIIKEFNWKEDNSHSYGLIAQELEEQGYSELVSIKDDGYKTVNYSAALSLIVGKLQVKIKELEKEIEILKNKN